MIGSVSRKSGGRYTDFDGPIKIYIGGVALRWNVRPIIDYREGWYLESKERL